MRKIIFTFITFLTLSFVGYAQNNINYNKTYAAGGRLLMCVDSNAKNVYYRDALPNQPNTFFSYLPGVDNISLQIYFRKEEKISNYRYTILTDDKPIVFNALSGIQNLINKNEIESANKYLTRFARLTRMILENKELVSLSEEKKLLEDYLQMEKLRFGFKFNIFHSEGLELGNIEIPSMLLQPFVENAVKHAIALKASEGQIIITFTEHGKDLVLTIKDNGNGFDINTKSTGLGLQLSENRIALLNSTYKENHFILAIQSDNKGTIISITLKGWL